MVKLLPQILIRLYYLESYEVYSYAGYTVQASDFADLHS